MKDEKYGLGETNFSQDQLDEMMSPALAEERARQKKYNEFLQGILTGDYEDNAGPYKLRYIVEYDSWHLPLTSAGKPEILNTRKAEYPKFIASISKKDGRRTDREGDGGQFLPIYKTPPVETKTKIVDGRSLVRSLPQNISGLLVESYDDCLLKELDNEYFSQLIDLANAVEIEDKLMSDSLIDPLAFQQYQFLAAFYKNNLWSRDNVAQIATHKDSLFINDDEVEEKRISGKELIKKLFEDPTLCGVAINYGHDMGRNTKGHTGMLLSLNLMDRFDRNVSGPFIVKELAVRNKQEFELWLTQTYFPTPYEIFEESGKSGEKFLYARSTNTESGWDMCEYETFDASKSKETARFLLREAPGNSEELASGTSAILCPGLMAKHLFLMLDDKHRKDHKWLPGKPIGIGRLLSAEDIALSNLRVQLANEILKLIPEGADCIDRKTILTVNGAKFFDWAGFASKKSWIENARDQAKKFNKNVVLGV